MVHGHTTPYPVGAVNGINVTQLQCGGGRLGQTTYIASTLNNLQCSCCTTICVLPIWKNFRYLSVIPWWTSTYLSIYFLFPHTFYNEHPSLSSLKRTGSRDRIQIFLQKCVILTRNFQFFRGTLSCGSHSQIHAHSKRRKLKAILWSI